MSPRFPVPGDAAVISSCPAASHGEVALPTGARMPPGEARAAVVIVRRDGLKEK